MSPGKHFACRIFSTEASCPLRAGCLFILSLSFCPNITNPLRLLYKANAAAGKHLPFSFYKVAAPSMLTPALPKAAYKLRCIFLLIQNRFSVFPPLLFKALFLFAPLFKKQSFLSFFLSPLPLCLENKKSVQSLHALCFFILQPNASDKIYPHNAEHHKGIEAQYQQIVSVRLCRVHNLSRVYHRRYQ